VLLPNHVENVFLKYLKKCMLVFPKIAESLSIGSTVLNKSSCFIGWHIEFDRCFIFHSAETSKKGNRDCMQSGLNIFDWHIIKQLIERGGYGWLNLNKKSTF